MINFTPDIALETLRENVILLQDLGDKINAVYIEVIAANARLRDKEADAMEEYFVGDAKIAVSAMSSWLKWKTAEERGALELLELELKRLKNLYDTADKVISAVQTANKINVTIANNTNL